MKNDHELYVIKRFTKETVAAKFFDALPSISRAKPPLPDFGGDGIWIEVTMATDTADARESAKFERSKRPMILLGELGGRFGDGASQPGRAWSSDILAAITRKLGKSICT